MSILKLLIDLKNIKLFLLCIIIPCIGISILFKNSKSKKLNIKIRLKLNEKSSFFLIAVNIFNFEKPEIKLNLK